MRHGKGREQDAEYISNRRYRFCKPVYCLVVCPSGISGDGYVLNVEKQRQLLPEWKDLKTGLVESCRWYLRHPEDVRKKGDVSFIDQNLAL